MLVQLAEAHVLGLESAFEEEIGQGSQQVFGADAEVVADVSGIVDAPHGVRSIELTAGFRARLVAPFTFTLAVYRLPAARPPGKTPPLAPGAAAGGRPTLSPRN